MGPIRVKVYGLFARTRRRYLREAAVGGAVVVLLLVAWWLGWPDLRRRLDVLDLPPWMRLTVRVLNHVPWILLGAAAYKALEVWLVLRAFTRREKAAAQASPAPAGGEPQPQPTPTASP